MYATLENFKNQLCAPTVYTVLNFKYARLERFISNCSVLPLLST